jgi:hypothetical protein
MSSEITVFNKFGIRIFRRDDRIFIEFDAGHIASQYKQVEVTEEEAAKAQLSEKDAYEVLLKYT